MFARYILKKDPGGKRSCKRTPFMLRLLPSSSIWRPDNHPVRYNWSAIRFARTLNITPVEITSTPTVINSIDTRAEPICNT
jgi:hypothetical protein